MPIDKAHCLKEDYRFEYTYNDKGQITGAKTIFGKSFLRERLRQYDTRTNSYIKKQTFGGTY